MEIEYQGISYTVDKLPYESDDSFYDRMWFIVKQEPKNNKEMERAKYLSEIWYNYKFNKCIYNNNIMKTIKNLDRNFYS